MSLLPQPKFRGEKLGSTTWECPYLELNSRVGRGVLDNSAAKVHLVIILYFERINHPTDLLWNPSCIHN
jgi:hypothetical protein